jgi:hypothetical protein
MTKKSEKVKGKKKAEYVDVSTDDGDGDEEEEEEEEENQSAEEEGGPWGVKMGATGRNLPQKSPFNPA